MRKTSRLIAVACAAVIISAAPISASAAPVSQGENPAELSAIDAGAVEVTEHPDGSITKEYANGDRIELGPVKTTLIPRAAATELGVAAFGDVTTMAAKSRNWTATYTIGLFGDYFSHAGGQIKNSYSFTACGTAQSTRLEVATSWGGYTPEGGNRSVPCSGTTLAWTSAAGNKQWWLEDPNQSDGHITNKASGTISWNG